MEITIIKADLKAIEPLRILFLKERNFQFVYNKCHQYGWADSFLYLTDNIPVGYGANMEGKKKGVRDNVFEFYVRPAYRKYIDSIFQKHCSTTNARYIECQSNDVLL